MFCKMLKMSLANFASLTLTDLCENELNKSDAVGAIGELRKADQDELVSKNLFRTNLETFNHNWNGTSLVPEWFNIYNGSVRRLGELAPNCLRKQPRRKPRSGHGSLIL